MALTSDESDRLAKLTAQLTKMAERRTQLATSLERARQVGGGGVEGYANGGEGLCEEPSLLPGVEGALRCRKG